MIASNNEKIVSNAQTKQQQLNTISTSVMAAIDTNQPHLTSVLQNVPENGESTDLNKIKRKTDNNIVNQNHETKAEEYAWYQLFPKGVNSLKEERDVAIIILDYFEYRIMGEDVRFQRNDYLFYALSIYESSRITSNITVLGNNIRQNDKVVEDIHLYIKNFRGSATYWRSAYNELLAQIRWLHYILWH